MLDFNSYCFCPELISARMSDPNFFYHLLLPVTTGSLHHLMLDRHEYLWLKYLEDINASGDQVAFMNLQSWRTALETTSNKIIYSDAQFNDAVDPEFISKIAITAPATCKKYIVTNNNQDYVDEIAVLRAQGVDLISEYHTHASANRTIETIRYNPVQFYHHMLNALSIVSSTRASRLENEHNDHLRDLLTFKGYTVKDQSRLGLSGTGRSIGNLDLIVTDAEHWVTIIEPLRLGSVDRGNIVSHYNKLIDNYNPLRLPHTHLVIYYTGAASGFNDFHERYLEYVSSLTSDDFSAEVTFNQITHTEVHGDSIKSFIQQGTINNSPFSCSHTCIYFSRQ